MENEDNMLQQILEHAPNLLAPVQTTSTDQANGSGARALLAGLQPVLGRGLLPREARSPSTRLEALAVSSAPCSLWQTSLACHTATPPRRSAALAQEA